MLKQKIFRLLKADW